MFWGTSKKAKQGASELQKVYSEQGPRRREPPYLLCICVEDTIRCNWGIWLLWLAALSYQCYSLPPPRLVSENKMPRVPSAPVSSVSAGGLAHNPGAKLFRVAAYSQQPLQMQAGIYICIFRPYLRPAELGCLKLAHSFKALFSERACYRYSTCRSKSAGLPPGRVPGALT